MNYFVLKNYFTFLISKRYNPVTCTSFSCIRGKNMTNLQILKVPHSKDNSKKNCVLK